MLALQDKRHCYLRWLFHVKPVFFYVVFFLTKSHDEALCVVGDAAVYVM